jgi:hypothetical protein
MCVVNPTSRVDSEELHIDRTVLLAVFFSPVSAVIGARTGACTASRVYTVGHQIELLPWYTRRRETAA